MNKKILLFFIIICILFSCRNKKDLTTPSNNSTISSADFNPFKKGNYYVYNVEEKHYSSGNVFDSSCYLKVSYPEVWKDAQGMNNFKIYRYKRYLDTTSYKINAVWSGSVKDENKVIITENNIPFIKLFYPLSENRKWDGNAYNTIGTETYTVANVEKSWDKYPVTVTVIHKNDTNLLARDLRMEIYALNVGLVYKETKTVKYSGSAEDFGRGKIVSGIVLKQMLLQYGVE